VVQRSPRSNGACGLGQSGLVRFCSGTRQQATLRAATQRWASGAAGSRSDAGAEAGGGRLQAGVRCLQRSGLLLPKEAPSDRFPNRHVRTKAEEVGHTSAILPD